MSVKSQIRISLSDREQEIISKIAKELNTRDCEILGSVVRTWLTGMILNKISI